MLLPPLAAPLQAGARDELAVSFEEVSARPAFPDSLVFSLRASLVGGTIVRAEVAYTFTGEAVTRTEVAELEPAPEIDVAASVDTRLDYIPPGVDITYYWTVFDDRGRAASSEPHRVRYDDTRFDWKRLEETERRLRLSWYAGGDAFGADLFDTAGRALDELEGQLGLTLTLPVEIWVYPDEEQLAEALPPHLPEWVGGKAFPQNGVIVALIDERQDGERDARRVLPHELTHLAVYQATANPYNTPPAWLDEGLALANQEVSDPFLDELLRQAAEANALLPLRTLGGSFPAGVEEAGLAYAQSASAVQFLLDRFGVEKVADVLAAFRDGVTYDEALEAGIGLSTGELDLAWRDWLPYRSDLETRPAQVPTSGVPSTTPSPDVSLTTGGEGGAGAGQIDPAAPVAPAGAPSPVILLAGAVAAVLLALLGMLILLRRRAHRPADSPTRDYRQG